MVYLKDDFEKGKFLVFEIILVVLKKGKKGGKVKVGLKV